MPLTISLHQGACSYTDGGGGMGGGDGGRRRGKEEEGVMDGREDRTRGGKES